MEINAKAFDALPEEDRKKLIELGSKFKNILYKKNSEFIENFPFLGRLVARYNQGKFIEAYFFFRRTGDPVIDQKMLNAILIRDYEVRFGLVTGFIWGSLFALLPGLKGYTLGTRLIFGLVPFSLASYRGYRRGYDQISYVGLVYLEFLIKKKIFLEFLHQNNGVMSEVKEEIMKQEGYREFLKSFGVEPYEND